MLLVASCELRVASQRLRDARRRVTVFARHSQLATRNFPPAFTFIEVLFAVILLGIGFIMIAGVFPVAIQQTAAVSDETQGTAIARDAIKKIQGVADQMVLGPNSTNTLFQPTYKIVSPGGTKYNVPVVAAFSYSLTQALGTDAFFTADRRYGWVGFYRRDSATSPFANVYVITLQNPNFPNYVTVYPPGETTAYSPLPPILPTVAPPIPPGYYNYANNGIFASGPPAGPAALIPNYAPTAWTAYQMNVATPPLGPSGCTVTLSYDNSSGNSYVQFPSAPTNAVTGAYLLVADDGTTGTMSTPPPLPLMNGRILRLGVQTSSSPLVFELQPGMDLSATDLANLGTLNYNSTVTTSGTVTSGFVDVFLIGRAPVAGNPEFTGPFTGPNQDIGVATAFIRVNTANN